MNNNGIFDMETLEFPLFCSELKKTFASLFAIDKLAEMQPKKNINDVLSFQNDLKVVLQLFDGNVQPPVENDRLFYHFYEKVKGEQFKYFSIEPEEYIHIKNHIVFMDKLQKYLNNRISQLGRLEYYIKNLKPDTEFAGQIDATFEENGNIKDGASPELRIIRNKMKSMKRHIQSMLQSVFNKSGSDKYIQEPVVVLRNGRYTIPCRTNFSQYITGIIHDRSASGQTVYVEPSSCVQANNELHDSIIAESEEIAKILAALAATFNQRLPELAVTIENYTELMFRIELAAFFYKYDITFPEFDKTLLLKEIHHPLLKVNKGRQSIPLDISLGAEQKLIVVSGPNTGGKTASLKSVGLNHIIAMCGLPVFARNAQMLFFTDIKADIGDNQSLVMDLSTFSSHMTNIKNIITRIGSRALVLFDELGTGTDPKDGVALALSILEYLHERGATVIVTTHFSELKAYAMERNDAKIYAVDFDYDTFEPRYRLLEGVAGRSDPVIIAERLDFPHSIIESAKVRLNEYKSKTEIIVEEAHLLKAEAEQAKRLILEKEKELHERIKQFEEKENELQNKLAKKELELLEDAYALLQKGKRLSNEKLKLAPDVIEKDIAKAGEKIQKIKSKQKPVEDVQVGDLIRLEKYSKTGKILELDSNTAYIDLEGIKVRIKRSELVGNKLKDEKPKQVKVSKSHHAGAKKELLLVGKRVEEALDLIDKFIDETMLAGYEKIYLVHGRGSGQLRNAIQEYLRTSHVKGYETASTEEGGNAVTVVFL